MEFEIQITCLELRLTMGCVDKLRATFAQRDVYIFYTQYTSEIRSPFESYI